MRPLRSAVLLVVLAAGCHLLFDPEAVPPPAPTELIYADASFPIGIAVESPIPPWTRGVPIDTFSSEPALPLGLSFDGDGGIGGTPLAIARPALYQVTATNASGSTAGFVEIAVNAGAISDLSSLSAAGDHTCVVTNGERVLCWGDNGLGELGDGNGDPARLPVMSAGVGPGVQSVASGDYHACAVAGGAASCWGAYYDGTTSGAWNSTPRVVVGGESGVQSIAAGTYHTCLVVAGDVRCWGANDLGQLGDGTQQWRTAPVAVQGLAPGATGVVAGSTYGCALVSGGVQCWGDNSAGQLGDSFDAGIHVRPFAVTRLPAGVQAVAAGGSHTCAIVDGGAYCWGSNLHGELGNGTVISTALPTAVRQLGAGVTAIATGTNHTCALTAGGVAWCWGRNDRGQVGGGAGDPQVDPRPVSGLPTGVQAIAAGASHTCAIVAGEVRCWGDNQANQLGNGSTAPSSGPAPVYFGGP